MQQRLRHTRASHALNESDSTCTPPADKEASAQGRSAAFCIPRSHRAWDAVSKHPKHAIQHGAVQAHQAAHQPHNQTTSNAANLAALGVRGPIQQNWVLIEELMYTGSKIRVATRAQPPTGWCSALRRHQTSQMIACVTGITNHNIIIPLIIIADATRDLVEFTLRSRSLRPILCDVCRHGGARTERFRRHPESFQERGVCSMSPKQGMFQIRSLVINVALGCFQC